MAQFTTIQLSKTPYILLPQHTYTQNVWLYQNHHVKMIGFSHFSRPSWVERQYKAWFIHQPDNVYTNTGIQSRPRKMPNLSDTLCYNFLTHCFNLPGGIPLITNDVASGLWLEEHSGVNGCHGNWSVEADIESTMLECIPTGSGSPQCRLRTCREWKSM